MLRKYFVNDAQKRNDWQYTKTKHNYRMSYRHQWQHFKKQTDLIQLLSYVHHMV